MIRNIILISSIFSYLTLGFQHIIIWTKIKTEKKYFYYFIFSLAISFGIFIAWVVPQFQIKINTTFYNILVMFSGFGICSSFNFLIGYVYDIKPLLQFLNRLFLTFFLVYIIISILYSIFKQDIFLIIFYAILLLCTMILLFFVPYNILRYKKRGERKIKILIGVIILGGLCAFGVLPYIIWNKFFFEFFEIAYMSVLLIFADVLADDYQKGYESIKREKFDFENQVQERTKELKEAKNKIEEESKNRMQFFIQLAHEMKHPATLIGNYFDKILDIGMSLKKHVKPSGIKIFDKLHNAFQHIKENIDQLIDDFENYLDSEKIMKGMFVYTHEKIINLIPVLTNQLILIQEAYSHRRDFTISYNYNTNQKIYIKINPKALVRIILNIIDNAFQNKKENKAGNVFISLKSENNKVLLSFADNGKGITEEQMKYLFVPAISLAEKERQNIRGSGTGLYVSKKVMNEIGGDIIPQSTENVGTIFTLSFPQYDMKENEEELKEIELKNRIISKHEKVDDSFTKKTHTILIVEDDNNMVNLLTEELKDNYNVYNAANGVEALSKLIAIPFPDLIITDIMMDQMDGLSLIKQIHNNNLYKAIPIIIISAKTSSIEIKEGLELGVIDYIKKPFKAKDVKPKIDTIINIIELQKEKKVKEMIQNNQEKYNRLLDNSGLGEEAVKVLDLIFEGFENKEIADKIIKSESTVKNYISDIFKVFDVKTRMQLFLLFIGDNIKYFKK